LRPVCGSGFEVESSGQRLPSRVNNDGDVASAPGAKRSLTRVNCGEDHVSARSGQAHSDRQRQSAAALETGRVIDIFNDGE
jgi:hypothetical protein